MSRRRTAAIAGAAFLQCLAANAQTIRPTGGTFARPLADKLGDVLTARDFGASGNAETSTGTIAAGSSTLALGAGMTLQPNMGVRINGAGAPSGLHAPTSVGGTPTLGGQGATTGYAYVVSAIDNSGGVGPGTYGVVNAAAAQLRSFYLPGNGSPMVQAAYNDVTWGAPSGGNPPVGYLIWAYRNDAWVLVGITGQQSWRDYGPPNNGSPSSPGDWVNFYAPDWAPAQPPASGSAGQPDWLVTTVRDYTAADATKGTPNTVTLNAPAGSSVSNALVLHDETNALQTELANTGFIVLPPSTAASTVPPSYGLHRITGGLALSQNGGRIQGSARFNVVLEPNMPFYDVVSVACGTSQSFGATIEDVAIIGPSRGDGAAIHVCDASGATVRDIHVRGGYDGIQVDSPTGHQTQTVLSHYTLEHLQGNGVVVGLHSSPTHYPNGVLSDNGLVAEAHGYGFEVFYGDGIWTTNDQMYQARGGYRLVPQSGGNVTDFFCRDCLADSSHLEDGFTLTAGPANGGVTGNLGTISLNGAIASSNAGAGVSMPNGPSLNGVTITGASIQRNGQHGIAISNTTGNNGEPPTAYIGSGLTVTNSLVGQNSQLSFGTYDGINIGSGVTGVAVVANRSGRAGAAAQVQGGTQNCGINSASASETVIQNNLAYDNVHGGICGTTSGPNVFVGNNG